MPENREAIESMPAKSGKVELSLLELREIAGYAVECPRRALPIYERYMPDDSRARDAIDTALAFSNGGKRTKALRSSAWAAFKAAREAREANVLAAAEAAMAAMHAAGAAYLHPLESADQVKHILGAAAHASRAAELDAGDDRSVGIEGLDWALQHAPSTVTLVLARYPAAPAGGGRVGELIRDLDVRLRP